MSLSHLHYDPFSDFDRLFDDAFSSRFLRPTTVSGPESTRDVFRPRMDVHENAENNTVTATFELPGVTPEQISIDVHQDRLTISGESTATQQQEERGYTVRERFWGKFARTLILPQGTKHEDVKAKMDNGLLSVTFPKGQPQQPKRITIE